jgi:hypothetical protein
MLKHLGLTLVLLATLLAGNACSATEATQSKFDGSWTGNASDSSGKSTLVWAQVSHNGELVAGAMAFHWKDSMGYGTVSGNIADKEVDFFMKINLYDPRNVNCKSEFHGKARMEGQAIVGTYSGSKCSSPVKDGHFSLVRYKGANPPKQ